MFCFTKKSKNRSGGTIFIINCHRCLTGFEIPQSENICSKLTLETLE